MNEMINTAKQLNTAALKAEIVKMAASDAAYATDVLMALLGALESRMPEAEFVAFCDAL